MEWYWQGKTEVRMHYWWNGTDRGKLKYGCSIDGMVLTGENWSTDALLIDGTDRGNWSTDALLMEWYWQGKTELRMQYWWNGTDREKPKYAGEKWLSKCRIFPPQNPHVLTWERTPAPGVTNRLSHCTAPTTVIFDKHSHHYLGTLAKCLPGHSHHSYTWPTQRTTYNPTVCMSTVNGSMKLNIRVSLAFSHMYRQLADVRTSALFPRCGKYEQGLDKLS